MAAATQHSPAQVCAMALAIVAAVVVGAVILDSSGVVREASRSWADPAAAAPLAPLGVQATLRSGDKTVERKLAELDLAIAANGSPDESLPAGPFEGDFTVTFAPSGVYQAKIGAELQGGSIIITRGETVLASDYADSSHSKTVLTNLPVWLPKRREQITYQFKSDGSGPVRLRAIWQPEDSDTPHPLGRKFASEPKQQAQAAGPGQSRP